MNINIYIVTVENNNKNYLTSNCGAGNSIFDLIQQNNLTRQIRQFLCYNLHHIYEPFVNLNNMHVPDGYM